MTRIITPPTWASGTLAKRALAGEDFKNGFPLNPRRLHELPDFKRHHTRQNQWAILGIGDQQPATRTVATKVSRKARVRIHRKTSTRSFHSGCCVRGTSLAVQRSAER